MIAGVSALISFLEEIDRSLANLSKFGLHLIVTGLDVGLQFLLTGFERLQFFLDGVQLRGEEILHHCKKKLGIGHKESTPDGMFHLEEVECIGACSWAPAMMLNYEYHENLTPEKIDELIDGIKKKEQQ